VSAASEGNLLGSFLVAKKRRPEGERKFPSIRVSRTLTTKSSPTQEKENGFSLFVGFFLLFAPNFNWTKKRNKEWVATKIRLNYLDLI
jgi:hypothetical protein